MLGDTEDWLYDEGEDQNKQVYIDKLNELKVWLHLTLYKPWRTVQRHNKYDVMILKTEIEECWSFRADSDHVAWQPIWIIRILLFKEDILLYKTHRYDVMILKTEIEECWSFRADSDHVAWQPIWIIRILLFKYYVDFIKQINMMWWFWKLK